MFKKLIQLIAVIATFIVPMAVFAAGIPWKVTYLPNTLDPGVSFTANYRFEGTFPVDVDVYAWVGEATTTLNFDDLKQDILVASYSANQQMSSNHAVTFDFSDLGFVAGKTYIYAISNGASVDESDSFFYQMKSDGNPPPWFGPISSEPTIFRCFTTTQKEVQCPNVQSGGGGGGSGNVTAGQFNYLGVPVAACVPSSLSCGFSVRIKATVSGALNFSLLAFPKTLHDSGQLISTPLSANTYTPTVTAGQEYVIPLGTSYANIQNIINSANDPKFYFQFYEANRQKYSPLSDLFDSAVHGIAFTGTQQQGGGIGSGGPGSGSGSGGGSGTIGGGTSGSLVLQGSQSVPLPNITVAAPTLSDMGTLHIEGVIAAPTVPKNTKFILKLGTDAQNLQDVGVLFEGNLTTVQAFSKNITAQTDGTYWFEIKDAVTDYSYGIESFTVNFGTNGNNGTANFNFGNNAGPGGAGVDGACGSAISTPAATQNLIGGQLCSAGTPSYISDGGATWNWTSNGVAGGNNTPCSVAKTAGATTSSFKLLSNPLVEGLDTFPEIFQAIYNGIVLPVAIPFIAIAIMYSGALFVIARKEGKVIKLEEAKRIFKFTMIGSVMLLSGFIVANALQSTLCQLMNNCPATQTGG